MSQSKIAFLKEIEHLANKFGYITMTTERVEAMQRFKVSEREFNRYLGYGLKARIKRYQPLREQSSVVQERVTAITNWLNNRKTTASHGFDVLCAAYEGAIGRLRDIEERLKNEDDAL